VSVAVVGIFHLPGSPKIPPPPLFFLGGVLSKTENTAEARQANNCLTKAAYVQHLRLAQFWLLLYGFCCFCCFLPFDATVVVVVVVVIVVLPTRV